MAAASDNATCQDDDACGVHLLQVKLSQLKGKTEKTSRLGAGPAQCVDGKFGLNFCTEWCKTPGKWGCGTATLRGKDGRNTDNEDYTCSCNGCNGCPSPAPAPAPPVCQVSLTHKRSTSSCDAVSSYGCEGGSLMYVDEGCRGDFICNGKEVTCQSWHMAHTVCSCEANAYKFKFNGLCIDGSTNGDCQCAGESSGKSFDECKAECDALPGCTGFAHHPGQFCKIYTGTLSQEWSDPDHYLQYQCYAVEDAA